MNRLIDCNQQTFEGLNERSVRPGDAFSRDLTSFVVGHDEQQVTGIGNANVIIASLVDTVG